MLKHTNWYGCEVRQKARVETDEFLGFTVNRYFGNMPNAMSKFYINDDTENLSIQNFTLFRHHMNANTLAIHPIRSNPVPWNQP